MVQVLFVVLVL